MMQPRISIFVSLLALLCGWSGRGFAQALSSIEAAAEKIQAATATVRVWNPQPDDAEPAPADAAAADDLKNPGENAREPQVAICSGVFVGAGLIVAPIYAGSDSQIKITLAGGEQCEARLRVIDEHSGLALLAIKPPAAVNAKPVSLAAVPPKVGSWVIGAAGWGTEAPVVSAGIVGGVDRTLTGGTYPPLLQCDLRTAITSGGAGIVNPAGELVGIVVAADREQTDRGWTYAMPSLHVARLLRVHAAQTDLEAVTVLKRRRPVVGMILDGKADSIVVSRVNPDSPAAAAGLQIGDEVLEADGVKIRSVYQALRPVLHKQPGDKIVFRIRRGDTVRNFEVVLGGGVELPAASFANLQQYVRPKLEVEPVGGGLYASRNEQGTLQELFSPLEPREAATKTQPLTSAEKIELLEKALDRYQKAILYLQNRLSREQDDRAKTQELIRSLEQQIEGLKRQLPKGK